LLPRRGGGAKEAFFVFTFARSFLKMLPLREAQNFVFFKGPAMQKRARD
jgi:hypothetical protein